MVPDLDGAVDLTPALVRALCDRHTGIGADGVLRVVRSENDPRPTAMAPDAPYFMDYRNADGSIAEMCGNGIRVVLRYLVAAGLVEHNAAVATRGGIKRVWVSGDGNVAVEHGPAPDSSPTGRSSPPPFPRPPSARPSSCRIRTSSSNWRIWPISPPST